MSIKVPTPVLFGCDIKKSLTLSARCQALFSKAI